MLTNGSAKLGSHCSGKHEIHTTTSDSSVGGKSTNGEDCEAKECVGDEEDCCRLKESSIAHDVADPQEEDGGEHGEGDGGKDALDHAKPLPLL